VVASVGTWSGPLGAVLVKNLEAAQAWVRFVNDKGGVNGHLVRHIVYDDGGDPARHKASVQEAIERHKVIAFVINGVSIAGRSSMGYINEKRVPVIGSEGGSSLMYESPMYFPQSSSGEVMMASGLYTAAHQLIPAGKTKLATVACVEIVDCDNADRRWAREAATVGFELVYRSRVSVTQPDYTAECLAGRNAGAEVVLFGIDPNSIARFALSCARQGYHPIFGTVSSLAVDRMKDDPNLDGMVASSNTFPYFQSGTPATDEFQRVMRTYGKGVDGVGSTVGWVAAKLFEKAAANLPEPPTAEAVLRGLWSIRDDTLGGLTQPLTFIQNEPTSPKACWFNLTVKNHAWVIFDQFKLFCR
jgi:ABC-type branched-subunit amino acid transport system substrate-binding protein